MRAGNPDLIRDLNRTLVLNLVRVHEQISRAELARRSGLSASTVTGITAGLMRDGFLVEVDARLPERGTVKLGRPATGLRVNPSAGHVGGVKLAAESITAVLVDLAGEPLVFHSQPHLAKGAAETAAAVGDALAAVSARADLPNDRLLGIGVGLPGIVDPNTGEVHASPLRELNGLDIAELLAGKVRVPVHVDNDVNTLTIAEHLFGAGRGARHLVVVSIGRGIGMGLVLNGVLYRGKGGGAGELGHVVVDPNGRACWCGRRGCLETVAAEPALVAETRRRTGRLVQPEDLDTAARADERLAELLEEAGQAVGRAVRNVLSTLDPERVVISGEGVRLGERYLGAMRRAILEGGVEGEGRPDIVHEPWGDEAWARGAASLVLGELFHPAHLPQPQELRPARRPVVEAEAAVPARAGGGG
jgi:predicted NBD/HSP70 family sugar kinase